MTPNEKPASLTQTALDCVVHALMVLPVPIDGQGKRAWASLQEAQDILAAALDRTTLPPTMDPAIREAVQLAVDFLKETKRGNGARSPGHNARLVLEAALASAPQGPRS